MLSKVTRDAIRKNVKSGLSIEELMSTHKLNRRVAKYYHREGRVLVDVESLNKNFNHQQARVLVDVENLNKNFKQIQVDPQTGSVNEVKESAALILEIKKLEQRLFQVLLTESGYISGIFAPNSSAINSPFNS